MPRYPNKPKAIQQLIEQWSIADKRNCWAWSKGINGYGYGVVSWKGKKWMAHRLAYFDFYGNLTPGLQIDHLCRNRACVNPTHLEEVTQHENQMRGNTFTAINSNKTHCPRGHALDAVYLRKSGRTHRCCSQCKKKSGSPELRKKWYAENKEKIKIQRAKKYKQNKKVIIARVAKYYDANREKILQRLKTKYLEKKRLMGTAL